MVTIDGMPIVSSLATVYGLFGIPSQLIDRIEIVKGPASSLYGSEAVGGLINIITKKPQNAPVFSGDVFATTKETKTVTLPATTGTESGTVSVGLLTTGKDLRFRLELDQSNNQISIEGFAPVLVERGRVEYD